MYSQNEQIILIFVSSAALIVFLAILVILFLVIYQKRIVKQDILLQKMENERQQLLLKASIEGQEKERRRLAKDLHDGIGSLLSGLSLNLKFQRDHRQNSEPENEFLHQACNLIDEGISNVRSISYNLMPVTLERFGLYQALKEITENSATESFSINLSASNESQRLDPTIELTLFRICQELVHNSIKHSGGNSIELKLQYNADECQVTFSDNGKGLPNPNWKEYAGIGLKGIESRVSVIGGKFELSSREGNGLSAKITTSITNNHE